MYRLARVNSHLSEVIRQLKCYLLTMTMRFRGSKDYDLKISSYFISSDFQLSNCSFATVYFCDPRVCAFGS